MGVYRTFPHRWACTWKFLRRWTCSGTFPRIWTCTEMTLWTTQVVRNSVDNLVVINSVVFQCVCTVPFLLQRAYARFKGSLQSVTLSTLHRVGRPWSRPTYQAAHFCIRTKQLTSTYAPSSSFLRTHQAAHSLLCTYQAAHFCVRTKQLTSTYVPSSSLLRTHQAAHSYVRTKQLTLILMCQMIAHCLGNMFVGLARTLFLYILWCVYIWCIYGIFGRLITKYTVIYSAYIRFWPTLPITLPKQLTLLCSEIQAPNWYSN